MVSHAELADEEGTPRLGGMQVHPDVLPAKASPQLTEELHWTLTTIRSCALSRHVALANLERRYDPGDNAGGIAGLNVTQLAAR
jgi:hypothetical protein